jgi:MinD-like ATPase involved in chromosome partitioning or flagellar assembly
MAVIALASASGGPGVTTTALGLAMVWPRPVVLAEADPVGGSALLAGYFHGTLADTDAMVSLVLAHRDGHLDEALPRVLIRVPDTHVAVLPGPKSHAQAGSLTELWAPLMIELQALEETGQDVIVDVGRLGMVHSPTSLIAAADFAVLVVRSDLPSLAAARQWASRWAEASAEGSGPPAGVVVVGGDRPYSAREVAKVITLPVLAEVAWDPGSAQVLSRGDQPAGRSWGNRSRLVQSHRALASALVSRLAEPALVSGGR